MGPDPTDWIKIVAIFGPVIGVILGAFGSWLQQWFFLRQSDKKRFHELRTEVYAKYLYTANKIMLGFQEGRRNDSDLDNLLQLGVQLSLVASTDVRLNLTKINSVLSQSSNNLPLSIAYQEEYNLHVKNFIAVARKELDVND